MSFNIRYDIDENKIYVESKYDKEVVLFLYKCCHITQLGTPWNVENTFRVRNNIKDYNLNYIIGNCQIHCTSDLTSSINEHGIHIAPLYVHHNTIFSEQVKTEFHYRWWAKNQCYLDKQTYECHPS